MLLESAKGAPLPMLTELLAQALVVEHGDRVAIIEVDASSARCRWVDSSGQSHVAFGGEASLDALLRRLAGEAHVVLLKPERAVRSALMRAADRANRVVYFTPDTFDTVPSTVHPGAQLYPVALLSGRDETARRGESRLYRAGTTRLTLSLAQFADPRTYQERPETERAALARIARSVTERTVGVALGGGGAWGYAHLALIEGMLDAGIPIDQISGVSFGSVCGAFFAGSGRDGLETLVTDGDRLMMAVIASAVSSLALERFVHRRLGALQLDALPIPFLPVATNIDTGEPEAIRTGRVSRAVRASGSLPGLLSPTIIDGVRFVDGGISANVPASVLPGEGADLIIAANVLQPPGFASVRTGRTRLARLLAELDPVARAKDVMLSMSTLTRQGGELTSLCAHVTYEARLDGIAPWDFHRAARIVDLARQDVASSLTRIHRAWESMARPGGGS